MVCASALRPVVRAWTAGAALVIAVLLAGACGGGGDDRVSDDEAKAAADRYFVTILGLFTGANQPQALVDIFAPECREDADLEGLAFVTSFIQALAPELRGLNVEAVDVGAVTVEHTDRGTLVSPRDPGALRVQIDGQFVPASEFFANLGFSESGDSDAADPLLLVRRDGAIYLGDCAELNNFSGEP